jgi:hypothetical protein
MKIEEEIQKLEKQQVLKIRCGDIPNWIIFKIKSIKQRLKFFYVIISYYKAYYYYIESLKKECEKEEMEQWFKSLLNDLEIGIRANDPESVFFYKKNEIIFELSQGEYLCNKKTSYLWCNYDLVWSVLRKKYKLNEYETKAFIKSMVEQHLKLEKLISLSNWFFNISVVEKHVKLENISPRPSYSHE